MRELNLEEVEAASGGMDAYTGASLILGLTSLAVTSPIVLGVGLGAACGLVIAKLMTH